MSTSLSTTLTPSASSATRSSAVHSEYRPDIDGMRAMAVTAVVGFHAAPKVVPGGFTGVDVFFVISGFLISGIILRGLSKGTFSFLQFYARRVKRIFPALLVALLSVVGLGWLLMLSDEYQLLGTHTAAGAGFILNFILYRNFDWYFGSTSTPLIHLWSLGVEEQFYLLWPLFVFAIWKISKRRVVIVAVVAIASFTLNVRSITWDPLASFYLPTSRLWELAAGSALAFTQTVQRSGSLRMDMAKAHSGPVFFKPLNVHVRGAVGTGLLVISFWAINGGVSFPGWWALLPTSGTLLVISAGAKSWINRFVFSNPVIVFVGLISYPLYLWHWPLLAFAHIVEGADFNPATAVCCIVASLLLAFLTYRYIELPLRSSIRNLAVALPLCAAMIICGSIGYLILIQKIPSRAVDAAVRNFSLAAMEDFPPKTRPEWLHADKLISVGKAAHHVVFIGDSNVYQYYSRIDRLISGHPAGSHDAVLAVRPSCALGEIDVEKTLDSGQTKCKALMRTAIEFAKRPDVDTVVIGASWYGYFVTIPDDEHWGDGAPLSPDTDRALGIVRETAGSLVRAGKRVYIILQIPIGVKVDPRQMIRRVIFSPGFTVNVQPLTRAEVMKAITPINTKVRLMAEEAGARIIDPIESLCDKAMCPTISSDGEPIYRDINHLRPSYVRDHVMYLDQTILAAGAEAVSASQGSTVNLNTIN